MHPLCNSKCCCINIFFIIRILCSNWLICLQKVLCVVSSYWLICLRRVFVSFALIGSFVCREFLYPLLLLGVFSAESSFCILCSYCIGWVVFKKFFLYPLLLQAEFSAESSFCILCSYWPSCLQIVMCILCSHYLSCLQKILFVSFALTCIGSFVGIKFVVSFAIISWVICRKFLLYPLLLLAELSAEISLYPLILLVAELSI